MPINFSLSLKSSNPGKKDPQYKVYATAQYTEIITLDRLAQKVARHMRVVNRASVIGILTSVVDVLREELLEGRRVELGDLGSFYCVINGTGAESVEDFKLKKNITGLNVNWRPGKLFRSLHDEAEYHYVPRRETQMAVMRSDDAKLAEMLAERPAKSRKPVKELSREEREKQKMILKAEGIVKRLLREEKELSQRAEEGENEGEEFGRNGDEFGRKFGRSGEEFGRKFGRNEEEFGRNEEEFGRNEDENSLSKIILMAMSIRPDITLTAIANELGMTRRAIEKQVKKLREQGLVTREGSTKSGLWHVHEAGEEE